jgi:NCS1 family nucleobase:cation symporter-1
VAAVMIVDYWVIRRCSLKLHDLYMPDGAYRYSRGWNLRAVAATAVGCGLAWGGLLIPALQPLFAYSWFVGFAAAGLTYWVLMMRR